MLSHIRRAKPWRPSVEPPGPEPRATLRKVASILRLDVLPAVCGRAEVFVATLSLLPLTVDEMGISSWTAIGMVLKVTDGHDAHARRHLGTALRLLAGTGRLSAELEPLLRRRRLVRAALAARLRACRDRPATMNRLSRADWEFSWAIYLRPMLALELQLAKVLDGFVEVNSPEEGVRPV